MNKQAIALTFDIETLYGSYLNKSKNGGKVKYEYLINEVDHILRICSDSGVKASFFVVGNLVKEYKDLIRRIADEGHEIASHSMSHAFFYTLDRAGIRAEIMDSKSILEDLCGCHIKGFRAPAWSITNDNQDIFYDALAESGFIYSSSVFPGKTPLFGIPGANPKPHIAKNGIIEFPMPTFKLFGKRMGFSGGFFFRLFPEILISRVHRNYQRRNAPLFYYFHPYEFDVCDYSFIEPLLSRIIVMHNRRNLTPRVKRLTQENNGLFCTMHQALDSYFPTSS